MRLPASPVALAYAAALAFGAAVVWQLVKNKKAIGAAITDTAKGAIAAITPTNPDNIIAQGANAVARVVTGDPGATVGSSLWEKLNPDAVAAEKRAIYGDPQRAAPIYPGLDAELRAGAPDGGDWRDTLAGAWEGAIAESANQNNARARIVEGDGGAAFGLYPGAK